MVGQANARIAALERLVCRRQLDIDCFRKALCALERPAAQGKIASASSKPCRWKQPVRMYCACASSQGCRARPITGTLIKAIFPPVSSEEVAEIALLRLPTR